MANKIFKITITNWHNENKKNDRCFTLENRFFEDSKISILRPIEVLIYVKFLAIASDINVGSFDVHAGLLPRRWRVNDGLMFNSLKSLQQFQLLTIENAEISVDQKKEKQKNTDLPQIETPDQLLEALGEKGLEKVLSLYEKAHVEFEFPFMAQWLCEKKEKKKNYTLFVMNWLKRSKSEYEARNRKIVDYNASMRMK